MVDAPSFFIWTIGCQMNAGDSHRLSEELVARGYWPTETADGADVVVLNTCVVRQSAEERVHGYLSSLKRLKRKRPGLLLAVMGCVVGTGPASEELPLRYPHVDLWLPPSRYEALLQRLPPPGPGAVSQLPTQVARYVTIMTGCNNFCSYCIVPYRRGRERSRRLAEIVAECHEVAAKGAREVTLLGQNVDSYGHDLPELPTLTSLLRQVHQVPDLWRIRFLTNHPKDMSQVLIEAVAALSRVCEHIELPLQSGNDDVLRRMHRRYTRQQFLNLANRIRATIPGVSLATDLIVGFPGETEEQFLDSYRLLEEVRFDAVHVAMYSPREGTTAAKLPDDVPPEAKERRRAMVEELQERVVGEINAALLGQTVEVLFEDEVRGKWRGRTRTNKLVFTRSTEALAGQLLPVRVTWTGPWSMQGDVATEAQRTQSPGQGS